MLHPVTLLEAAKGKGLAKFEKVGIDPHTSRLRLDLGLSQARAILHILLPRVQYHTMKRQGKLFEVHCFTMFITALCVVCFTLIRLNGVTFLEFEIR